MADDPGSLAGDAILARCCRHHPRYLGSCSRCYRSEVWTEPCHREVYQMTTHRIAHFSIKRGLGAAFICFASSVALAGCTNGQASTAITLAVPTPPAAASPTDAASSQPSPSSPHGTATASPASTPSSTQTISVVVNGTTHAAGHPSGAYSYRGSATYLSQSFSFTANFQTQFCGTISATIAGSTGVADFGPIAQGVVIKEPSDGDQREATGSANFDISVHPC